jgi:DNA-binding transcriptional regulator YiaG
MYTLSPQAAALADELAAAFDLLRHAIASIEDVETGVERAALSKEVQGACERFSQAGARSRRAAIKFMRDDESMTQDQIADAIGVSRPRVSEMLRP